MSASSQTHPTAFTKNELGWLDGSVIAQHPGGPANYDLQHISLAQPPAAGRVAAVRIGSGFPYVMVESRKMTDQFEAGMPSTHDRQERGIASEGVIAYRVQTRNPTIQEREGHKKPLFLMTLTALQPSQSAALDNGVTLTVAGGIPGGFAIQIKDPKTTVPDVLEFQGTIAKHLVQQAGLVPKFTGATNLSRSFVFSQSPLGGEVVNRGNTVTMRMKIGEVP
jgi:hypothetical protein